jgi:hypothetical protein
MAFADLGLAPPDLPPPPRAVEGRPGPLIWLARVFSLPHAGVGVASLAGAAFLVLWAVLGTVLPAEPLRAYTTMRKGQINYQLDYRYFVDGHEYAGSESVSGEAYRTLERDLRRGAVPVGVAVRYFALGPLHLATLTGTVGPSAGARWATALFLAFFFVLWNGVVGSVLWTLWVRPIREKRLYRDGHAARGRVIGRRRKGSGKGARFLVEYEFRTSDGTRETGEVAVRRAAQWEQVHEQQEVTVLYWPARPKRSLISELGSYRILRAGSFT